MKREEAAGIVVVIFIIVFIIAFIFYLYFGSFTVEEVFSKGHLVHLRQASTDQYLVFDENFRPRFQKERPETHIFEIKEMGQKIELIGTCGDKERIYILSKIPKSEKYTLSQKEDGKSLVQHTKYHGVYFTENGDQKLLSEVILSR